MRRGFTSQLTFVGCWLWIAFQCAAQEPAPSPFREILTIAEWTPERFEQFTDDEPLNEASQAELAKLLLRLKMMPSAKLNEWARKRVDAAELRNDPSEHRGELFQLKGQVVGVTEFALPPAAARALDRTSWYVCEIRLASGDEVEVIAPSVPKEWLELVPLNQPITCNAVFLRRGENVDGENQPEFVTSHMAWFPNTAQPPLINFGMATLGSLGVDLAGWSSISRSGRLQAEDHAAFYETLSAMRKVEAGELAQLAESNLGGFAAPYREELAELDDDVARTTRRGTILREVVTSADEGRYSAWPLFLEPGQQRGQLFVFDGIVRRALRVDTSIDDEGDPSGAMRQFGIDQYYEVELFTNDSQNLPLVFCVLELPVGFPTGEDLREPARIAGFFFKTWQYHGRGMQPSSSSEESAPNSDLRRAPLLIGRGPLKITPSEGATPAGASAWVGALLVLAIAGVWLMAWWFGRGDRQFENTTLARLKSRNQPVRIELPPSNEG